MTRRDGPWSTVGIRSAMYSSLPKGLRWRPGGRIPAWRLGSTQLSPHVQFSLTSLLSPYPQHPRASHVAARHHRSHNSHTPRPHPSLVSLSSPTANTLFVSLLEPPPPPTTSLATSHNTAPRQADTCISSAESLHRHRLAPPRWRACGFVRWWSLKQSAATPHGMRR
jgi:hypothetical protein